VASERRVGEQPRRDLLHLGARGDSGHRQFAGPGKLRVGVLLPTRWTLRMFLITYLGGRVLTAPFTLKVS
jgi:hypothetical protein